MMCVIGDVSELLKKCKTFRHQSCLDIDNVDFVLACDDNSMLPQLKLTTVEFID